MCDNCFSLLAQGRFGTQEDQVCDHIPPGGMAPPARAVTGDASSGRLICFRCSLGLFAACFLPWFLLSRLFALQTWRNRWRPTAMRPKWCTAASMIWRTTMIPSNKRRSRPSRWRGRLPLAHVGSGQRRGDARFPSWGCQCACCGGPLVCGSPKCWCPGSRKESIPGKKGARP
jgi:hypothetical protein